MLKLRHRKIVQWGLGYGAGAWGLLQVIGFFADTFHWPELAKQLAAIALIAGFPIALTLAWYHGDRGHQRVTRSELATIGLLLMIGGGAMWLYGHRSAGTQTVAIPAAGGKVSQPPAPADTRPSVAVLPFVNMSADPGNEYLADGIADTLLTMLAQVGDLKVIARTSSFSFKGKSEDVRTIGRLLGVGAVLEGSVQRSGDRLRITTQLISTADGSHLWAETYDRRADDIFRVQDEIASSVTKALSVALAGKHGPGSIGTTNVAAYDAYLRGKQAIDRRENKSLEQGIAFLQQSVAADPGFARAWVELSQAHLLSRRSSGGDTPGSMSREQALQLSERAARRAVAASPEFGAAHAALGQVLWYQDKDGADQEFVKATSLSPDDPTVIRAYATFLRNTGRPREALKVLEPLLSIEPRDAALRVSYGQILDVLGDIPGALGRYRQAIRLRPDLIHAYQVAALTTARRIGSSDLGLRLLRRALSLDPHNVSLQRWLAGMALAFGEDELLGQVRRELKKQGANDALMALDARSAILDRRPREAREIAERMLADGLPPEDAFSILAPLPGTGDERRETLRRLKSYLASGQFDTSSGWWAAETICLAAWTGDQTAAVDELARWEPVWNKRHAYGYFTNEARFSWLARSLACVGRRDEALTELEALLKAGYDIGWRAMSVDPAFDAIRDDPRFKAVSDQIKAASEAAGARFRARPDLNDSDVDSLGN